MQSVSDTNDYLIQMIRHLIFIGYHLISLKFYRGIAALFLSSKS